MSGNGEAVSAKGLMELIKLSQSVEDLQQVYNRYQPHLNSIHLSAITHRAATTLSRRKYLIPQYLPFL